MKERNQLNQPCRNSLLVYRGFVHKRNLLALIDDMKNIVNTFYIILRIIHFIALYNIRIQNCGKLLKVPAYEKK